MDKGLIGALIIGIACLTPIIIILHDDSVSRDNHNERMLPLYLGKDCIEIQKEISEYDNYWIIKPPKYLIEAEKQVCTEEKLK